MPDFDLDQALAGSSESCDVIVSGDRAVVWIGEIPVAQLIRAPSGYHLNWLYADNSQAKSRGGFHQLCALRGSEKELAQAVCEFWHANQDMFTVTAEDVSVEFWPEEVMGA